MIATSTSRIRPLDAARALHALFLDPDDTSQVFELIEAVSGKNRRRVLDRLLRSEAGRRLLAERRSVATVLADRARLAAMAPDSLGRAYLALCDRAGITPDGLIAASQLGKPSVFEGDESYVHHMLRDSHDLWHVVTGYQTDVAGEAAVLAFTFAQTRNPGVLLIALLMFVDSRGERSWVRPFLLQAFWRGMRCAWFPETNWEAMLGRPLDEVRRELRIDGPPAYTPLWSAELKRAQ